ncbi:SpoIIE family protein phosphatase [Streptomyces cavernicola]|uniref:SpoIIE family protein phosphatase n=1 Tax=Streptomyces cavernicola TaxID=3043613 RepID=A0ABT6SLN0_9ACTN|nr:SpoIIE family protein phosphatase [Streptomyces sp. B-S-A6]MDI3408131.1 SpoIIE family protein phosphatase [Streptomyces sp. B-S-A6]
MDARRRFRRFAEPSPHLRAGRSARRRDVPRPEAGSGAGSGPRSASRLLNVRTVAGQVFLLQLAIVLLLVAAAAVALVLQARRDTIREAQQRTIAVAESFANAPGTLAALGTRDPTAVLQPRAEETRKRTGVDYVVVWNTDGIRYTHPDPALIGKHVIGPFEKTLEEGRAGRPYTDTFEASTGRTVNTGAPVLRPDGSLAGVVSAGITVQRVEDVVGAQMPLLAFGAAGALALSAGGSVLVSRRLRRQTHGLGATEMTRMYEHHDAVLHAVREGVLIIGGDGRLLLANDEARRLLDLPPDAEQRPVTELGLDADAAELLVSGRTATDELHLAGERLLAVNLRSIDQGGGPSGSVATLRDTTELRALAGRADVARERLRLLYDSGVRLGTTLDVVRTAEELAEVATPRFADFATVELLEPVLRGEEPGGDAAMMCRVAIRGLRDRPPFIPPGERIPWVSTTPMAVGIAEGHAVLLADLESSGGWRDQDPERAQAILDHGVHSLISVPLRARGVLLGLANFWRSEQEPFEPDDLSFAEELTARAAVAVDNARRYTHEHSTAVALQRSLLPRSLPEQSAVEVAHRYLPAKAGVGGDWFDVIPLPGARVALVVGDVVGHGLHAAATMGRLRTAVHNFSALDLPPEELLSHLDELVARIDQEEGSENGGPQGITGATCLYAVYDPVTGVCTMARSGHPGPALVDPEGAVTFPDVPVSPPLGLGGGLPFEAAQVTLGVGAQLVLYTDGLVEDRGRDLDTGLALLRSALEEAHGGPEATCTAVLDALLSPHPGDDVALLVAQVRILDPDRIAEWEVPSDPAAVSRVRSEVTRRLGGWGLAEATFTMELVVSELVTNAIRYGIPPVRLRLLYDRNSLICEVSDGSSTSPHLRRANTTDEGGRGLFLVAQFSERWGTRYTARGKVIWTEQPVHVQGPEPDDLTPEDLLAQWDDEL